MTRKTTPTIEAPSSAAPTTEPAALAAVRRDLAQAEQQVTEAAHLVAERQDAAIPLALRHRDLQEILRLRILAEDDPRVRDAVAAWQRARQGLDQARDAQRHAEQDRAQARERLAREEAAADRVRRREWAEQARPDLTLKLLEARVAEQDLLANEYARDSIQGQADLRAIRHRLRRLDVAVEDAARQAPAE